MTTAAALKVAGDLLHQADKIRTDHPDVAAALEANSYRLLADVPFVSVAEAAELLGQSRPTIYEWVKAGYLLTEDAAARGVSISADSLIKLIPILEQWEDAGRPGRPSVLLREWFEGALELRERRRDFATRRRAGAIGLKPPPRPTVPQRVAVPA